MRRAKNDFQAHIDEFPTVVFFSSTEVLPQKKLYYYEFLLRMNLYNAQCIMSQRVPPQLRMNQK